MAFLFEQLHPTELNKIIKDASIVYFPLGSLEWHERHLPFGLDAMVSYYLCQEACKKTGGCVLPPFYFGTDREHIVKGKIFHGMDARVGKVLPGSIYFLKKNLFLQLLKQIVLNISEQGFQKLIIVSAHSGLGQQKVLEKLTEKKFGNFKIIVIPGKTFKGGMDHASRIETSLMMAIQQELVHLSWLSPPYQAIFGEDPKLASIEEGNKRLKNIVDQIVRSVTD